MNLFLITVVMPLILAHKIHASTPEPTPTYSKTEIFNKRGEINSNISPEILEQIKEIGNQPSCKAAGINGDIGNNMTSEMNLHIKSRSEN